MAKLTPKAERIFQDLCILTTRDSKSDGYVRRPAYFGGALDELSELGLIDLSMPRKVRLTDAGREYAITQGWIAAPAAEASAMTSPNDIDEPYPQVTDEAVCDDAEAPAPDAVTPAPFAVGDYLYIVLASGVIIRDVVTAVNDKDLETAHSYIIPFERCFDQYPQAHYYRNYVIRDAVKPVSELDALRAEVATLKAQLAAARAALNDSTKLLDDLHTRGAHNPAYRITMSDLYEMQTQIDHNSALMGDIANRDSDKL